MTMIKITQTATIATGFNTTIQFEDGPPHPVSVTDPFDSEQEEQLQWYFEEWLIFPYTGHIKAGRAADSVTAYGEQLFAQLFQGEALTEYKMALRYEGGLAKMAFEVRGDPAFHALHWEALKDPDHKRPFALECPFVRPNNNPPPIHIRPQPSPTLNILLVTARPKGRRDVGYRTISRPLVEGLQNSHLRAHIDIVRPGTYAALVRHLEASRDQHGDGYYHIVHFDVHGSLLTYAQYASAEEDFFDSPHVYKGYGQQTIPEYEGVKAFLAFNGVKEGKTDLVADTEIGELLKSHQIPIAVLNACQSGMQVGDSETSLASHLMAAGVQVAVGMGYSVTVSAAKLFMDHFYQHLLAGKAITTAIRQARAELYNHKVRRARFNQMIDLEDWLLPVVYQNRTVKLPITNFATPAAETAYYERGSRQYHAPKPTYGFVGRDVDILEIERRLLSGVNDGAANNILLIQGMGGTGKTTLLRHLMQWWQTTRLVERVYYFGYDAKAYTRTQIMDALARDLYGAGYGREFLPFSDAVKQQKLCDKLRSENHLLVLDNLESITGAALSIQHTLDGVERGHLRDFVGALAGGKTLLLLGSRGAEEWLLRDLGKSPYILPGLDPEAASLLAERILNRLGKQKYAAKKPHRKPFAELLKLLDGYPLALEIVLANLARQTPQELLDAFSGGEAGVDAQTSGELWQDKTQSILRCVEYSHSNLSPDAQALLACLTPFTGVFNSDWLPQYSDELKKQPALADLPFEQWPTVLTEAQNWGLLTPYEVGGGYLRLQPILPYFLRQRLHDPAQATERTAVEAAFRTHYDEVGGALAQLITSKEAQQRQTGLTLTNLEYENLLAALKLALAQQKSFWHIYDNLSEYLSTKQASDELKTICELILTYQDQYPQELIEGEIGGDFFLVSGNLGNMNLNLKQYDEAEKTYRNAIQLIPQLRAFDEKQRGKWLGTAYHQLGMVAQAQRDWQTAVSHYKQALQIKIEFNDRYAQASTYHQLGYVAQAQREWQTAVSHYKQALQIKIEFNDRYTQANTYHQLGIVAQEQRDLQTAVSHYKQALQIFIEFNDKHRQATVHHQLGRVAEEQRDWQTAVSHYKQALQIFIEFNDRYAQADVYHQLGMVAQEHRDWQTAVSHYKQALQIYIEFNDRYEQADIYHQLGRVAQEQREWQTAESHYKQALQIFNEFNDRYAQASSYHQLGTVAQEQRDWQTAESHYKNALQICIDFNDRYSQASTYHQLGNVAEEQRDWQTAESHYKQALQIKIEFNDRYAQASTYGQLGLLAEAQENWLEAANHLLQALEIFVAFQDTHSRDIAIRGLAQVWQANQDNTIPNRLAEILGITPAEAQARLQKA